MCLKIFKSILLISFLKFLFFCSEQIQLIPQEENGLWGYQTQRGERIIKPQFIIAHAFSKHGLAAVVDSAGWAYINRQGELILRPFIYDNGPDYFSAGLSRYTENGKFGFFDESGKIIIKAQWDFALPFNEGLAAVCHDCRQEKVDEHMMIKGGLWGFIDPKGMEIIPLQFEAVRGFVNGQAEVKIKGTWKRIDKTGKIIDMIN